MSSHDDTELSGHEEDEPWWWITRENAWRKFNVAAAIAVGVYLFWQDDFYNWLARKTFFIPGPALAGVLLVAAVPVVQLLYRRGQRTIAAWAILATVLGVYTAGHAGTDAQEYLNYNCWTLSTAKDGTETVACAPGMEPRQSVGGYDRWSDTVYDGRFCELVEPAYNEPVLADELAKQAERAEEGANVTLWECN